ncbi:hypothetical protein EZ444_05825 [Pedobacter hiemivivus]|uniref:DUF1653 domain-containing protein n=1 Tax=Pedobacter hiemivivus TaxID=2530454 RepID=A0A4R0NHI9_9SPHI|nr:hypothetical protein EZ444_05825 [Pedobacter hiemivivus]
MATRKKNKPHKFRPDQVCILRFTGQKVLILGTVYHAMRNKWAYAVMYRDQLGQFHQAEIPEAQLSYPEK